MSRSNAILRTLLITAAVGATNNRIRACGPDFPTSMIQGGETSLLKAPIGDFQHEVERLCGTADPRFRALPLENPDWATRKERADQTTAADVADLLAATHDQPLADALNHWRETLQSDPAAAGDPPAALPAEFALYDRAVALYVAKDLDGARKLWQQLLALPESQRHWRSAWAAYMIGRSYVETDPAKAVASFEEVRAFAANGYADTAGLAAASFGWQARAEWKARHTLPAIHLYLQQAAAKDPTAAWSLRDCAVELLAANDARLQEAANDPDARNVITACFVSHFGPYSEMPGARELEKERRWLAILGAFQSEHVPDSDRLAWAAYQSGDIPTAERWLRVGGKEARDTPIGQWLQAKLALRNGKVSDAAKFLAAAAKSFPQNEQWPQHRNDNPGDPVFRPAEQVAGELAALKLSRSQYVDALDLLFRNNHWSDAAYVAERVLTVDELKSYIDKNWPKFSPSPPKAREPWDDRTLIPADPDSLRQLLARRLTRNFEFDQARPYFLPENQKRLDAFAAGVHAGRDHQRLARQRALSLFNAARIARHDGLALLATEGGPDVAEYDAEYPFTVGRKGDPVAPVSADERRRVADSAPDPDKRFSYRYVAADLAWQAAKLLPDNSDLTAAILVEAGTWLEYRDPPAADRFYKTLVARCPNTSLGHFAAELHWFPSLPDKPTTAQP